MVRADPAGRRERAEQIESAVREIDRYLHAHPNASDTLEGVRDWWLAGHVRPFTVDVIQAALDRLVDNRILEARSIPGGVLYAGVKHRSDL